MKITKTNFEGLLLIEPPVYTDKRGYFFEAFNQKQLSSAGIAIEFVQDNQSFSVKNVVRGLHFQRPPHSQTKLIRVLEGAVLDVVVDLRKGESTFGKSFAIQLSAENKMQLLIPKGFAHGFSVLTDAAEILYKCDDYYHPELEGGIRFDDPNLAIDWNLPHSNILISDSDRRLPAFSEVVF